MTFVLIILLSPFSTCRPYRRRSLLPKLVGQMAIDIFMHYHVDMVIQGTVFVSPVRGLAEHVSNTHVEH